MSVDMPMVVAMVVAIPMPQVAMHVDMRFALRVATLSSSCMCTFQCGCSQIGMDSRVSFVALSQVGSSA